MAKYSWKHKSEERSSGERTKRVLKNIGVKPSKSRGQNFAISPAVTQAIVDFAQPRSNEYLVEIGPGLGALTDLLLPYGLKDLVEIEENFCTQLQQKYPQLSVHQADARYFDYAELAQNGNRITVFGNLPYIFSTEIVVQLMEYHQSISRAILLLQKEFVERLAASEGGRDYGTISISRQIVASARMGPIIAGDNFFPPAKVQSQVVELTFHKEPVIPVEEIAWLKVVVRAAFHMRRKMIDNSLIASRLVNAEKVPAALEKAGIDSKRRAETVSLQEYRVLAKALA